MALQPYIAAWADSMSAIAELGIDEALEALERCAADGDRCARCGEELVHCCLAEGDEDRAFRRVVVVKAGH